MRHLLSRLWFVVMLILSAAALGLTGSYLISAYHLEAAGRWMGELPSQTADLARAQRHLQQAVKWDPENAQAYLLLGKVYEEQDDWAAANEALTRYGELRPDSPLGYLALAEYYAELEARMASLSIADLLSALPEAEVQTPAAPLTTPHGALGSSAWHGYVARTTFDLPPDPVERPTLLMHPPSSATYTVRLPEEPTILTFGIGFDLGASGGTEDSAIFEVQVDGSPAFSERLDPSQGKQGWQERTVDLADWAGQEVELTLQVVPGPSGSTSGAWAGWGEPQVVEPQWSNLKALASRGKLAEAWRALGMSPADLINLGESAREDGMPEEALVWYERAAQVQPNNRDPWHYIGQAYEAQGEWQKAIDAYDYGLSLSQSEEIGRSQLHAQKGNVYQRLVKPPQLEEALAAYQAALAEGDYGSAREAAWVQARLGQVNYALGGDAAEAEARLRKALEIAPEDAWLYIALGDFLGSRGRTAEAKEMYQQALERAPNLGAAKTRLEELTK